MAARYWLAQLVRAVVAFVVGALISLDQSHSATIGIVYFAIFAIVGGLTVAAFWFVTDAGDRTTWLVQGLVGVAVGVVALVVHSGGLGALLYSVSLWGVLTGALELYGGLRARRRDRDAPRGAVARDRILVGGLTVVLAVVYLVIPAEHRLVVGLFGAYAAVIGVYLAIGALSLKWAAPGRGADEASESHA